MRITQATSHRESHSRKWPGFIPLFYSVTGCEQPGGKCNPRADTSVSFCIHHLVPLVSYSPCHEINERILHGHQITWFSTSSSTTSPLCNDEISPPLFRHWFVSPTLSPQPLTQLIFRTPLMPLIVNITENSKDNNDVQTFCLGLTITRQFPEQAWSLVVVNIYQDKLW